jgi:t-SNARE complex subunit (syntaxin)
MSGKTRRTNERRHRRLEEARDKVHEIRMALESEKDEEKIKELRRKLDNWSLYSTRRANQL